MHKVWKKKVDFLSLMDVLSTCIVPFHVYEPDEVNQ